LERRELLGDKRFVRSTIIPAVVVMVIIVLRAKVRLMATHSWRIKSKWVIRPTPAGTNSRERWLKRALEAESKERGTFRRHNRVRNNRVIPTTGPGIDNRRDRVIISPTNS
jgi:hypothetical protein